MLWDGVEYFCVAKDASEITYNGMMLNGIYLGNIGGFFNAALGEVVLSDTGEPFYCSLLDGTLTWAIQSGTEENHTVCVQKIKTLDSGWISDSVVTKDYLETYMDQYINEALGGEY